MNLDTAWVLVPYGPAATMNAPYDYTVHVAGGFIFPSHDAAEAAREMKYPGYTSMLLSQYIQQHVQAATRQTHEQIRYRLKEMWSNHFPNIKMDWY